MPDDMEFSPEDGSYTSSETGVKIRAEHAVRVKIIGATILQSTLCAIGSIKEPYLGLLA
jgi:DNA-directed RNA polymerase subunit E'/Rpb7